MADKVSKPMILACRFHGPDSLTEYGSAAYSARVLLVTSPIAVKQFGPGDVVSDGAATYSLGEPVTIRCDSTDNFDGKCGEVIATYDLYENAWTVTRAGVWAVHP